MKKITFPRLKKYKKRLILGALACLLLSGGIFAGIKSGVLLTENQKFNRFTQEMFTRELSSNTLNMHYTLAYPKSYGIEDYTINLGSLSAESMSESYNLLQKDQQELHSFTYKKLSEENQLTYDILDLDIKTQLSAKDHYMLTEVLSPNLGIQAQLPVLLAEYTFRTQQDVEDYLGLLNAIPQYFDEILEFQQLKAQQGLFMSDTAVDRVIDQCELFLTQAATASASISTAAPADGRNLADNYLSIMFQEKLADFEEPLTEPEISSYILTHENILTNQVVPAYSHLMEGLEALKGSGTNINGLMYLPGGTKYYEYLIQSETGDYSGAEAIEKRLYTQLLTDYKAIKQILTANPELIQTLASEEGLNAQVNTDTTEIPSKMLKILEKALTQDFPEMEIPSYEVKYVHSSLEEFSSPAFYLTPPVDTLTPNIIYINNSSTSSKMDLFTTLAHEGFPGHLYQTVYFGQCEPSDIRNILNYGGYTEGWATYVEAYSYQYLSKDQNLTQLLWLNRSINLCLYSIMDIGIHYRGWTVETVTDYLESFGISDTAVCQEIFQYIVENPANYLKYYIGYLNFMDLREQAQDTWGDDFTLKEFHKKILEIGPSQFPVLEKYLF